LRIALPSELWSTDCKSPAMVPSLWHPACCGSRQQRPRPVLGLQHHNPAQRRGFRPPDTSQQ
jgi:hypothetical protein